MECKKNEDERVQGFSPSREPEMFDKPEDLDEAIERSMAFIDTLSHSRWKLCSTERIIDIYLIRELLIPM